MRQEMTRHIFAWSSSFSGKGVIGWIKKPAIKSIAKYFYGVNKILSALFVILRKGIHVGLYARSVYLFCLIITKDADISPGGCHLFPLVLFSKVHAAFPAIGHCLF